MAQVPFDLSDLLTATGSAMALSNARLAACGAPALLQTFTLELNFSAGFQIGQGAGTLMMGQPRAPNPQMQTMMQQNTTPVSISATFIAAPSLKPPPGSKVCGP
jgi:hypothetical protein